MDLLRRSNPFEPPSAYSDDPILGPNFYRIGKIEYDLHSPDYAQTFKLNTIVDVSTIRVDKVVFRVTSNWGANHTCIYRFKLHGHL
jgi:Sad1 / UNC-like C-terminal.